MMPQIKSTLDHHRIFETQGLQHFWFVWKEPRVIEGLISQHLRLDSHRCGLILSEEACYSFNLYTTFILFPTLFKRLIKTILYFRKLIEEIYFMERINNYH